MGAGATVYGSAVGTTRVSGGRGAVWTACVSTGRGIVGTAYGVTDGDEQAAKRNAKHTKNVNRQDTKCAKALILFANWARLVVIVIDRTLDAVFH